MYRWSAPRASISFCVRATTVCRSLNHVPKRCSSTVALNASRRFERGVEVTGSGTRRDDVAAYGALDLFRMVNYKDVAPNGAGAKENLKAQI